MFSRVSDASKVALKSLCEILSRKSYHLIDCQIESAHLMSLGAETVPRVVFIDKMNGALQYDEAYEKWTR